MIELWGLVIRLSGIGRGGGPTVYALRTYTFSCFSFYLCEIYYVGYSSGFVYWHHRWGVGELSLILR